MWNRTALIALFFAFIEIARSQFNFPFFGAGQNLQSNFNPQNQYQGGSPGFGFYPQQQQNFGFPQQNFGFPNFYQNQNNRPNQQYPNRPQNNYNQQNQRPPQNQNQRPTTHRPVVHNPPATQSTQAQSSRPIVTTASPLILPSNARISQRKCVEYANSIKKKVQVASLAADSIAQDITVTDCDAVTGLIVGGVDANPGEFPHQAAIGYPDLNGDLSFKCGGSLISELFVLTAAHCSSADRTKPSTVRLGDTNLAVKENGLPEVDIPIEQFINHESYNKETRENDIALIKMTRAAVISKYIRPACLQQTENIGKVKAVATGWGYTEVGGSTSNILQKVQLDIIDNQKCKEVYDDEENYNIFNSQLCAGVLKGGKDTCGGDSGGPLQTTIGNQCIFNIIGLTSYGSTFCGGKNSPGIYTRVSSYLDWIEANVWAQ